MNQKLLQIKDTILSFWRQRTKWQKALIIGGASLIIIAIIVSSIVLSKPKMIPLYTNLSLEEAGRIKETLDNKGIQSEIADNGTTIKVPESEANALKVELAAEGIPESGNIDYSYFGQNIGFGMTDNEFDVLKLKATQTELANLIKEIEGVKNAKVMVNLPKETVFVGEDAGEASASIVLNLEPGYKLDQSQVNALYHLVSKSVPNLPVENIVIMDQNFDYYDLKQEDTPGTNFASQLEIKSEIEKNIQRQVQRMLGTMMGQDKVVVNVSADIDFTQEKREENLVEPVDEENNEGIAISAERITETYTGTGAQAAGVAGTGQTDVPNTYQQAAGVNGEGEYEKIEDRINYEVNRIKREIVESPYKIRDLGIQVMVEPPNPENPNSLPQQSVDDIEQILSTIVRTSINEDPEAEPLTDQDIEDKIVVSVQPFSGKINADDLKEPSSFPIWGYVLIGAGILLLGLLFLWWWKRRRDEEDEYEDDEFDEIEEVVPQPVQEEESVEQTKANEQRRKLEELAKEKPDEFAKLLRTWLYED